MNIAEVQDKVEKYLREREGKPKHVAQIKQEMKEFIKSRDSGRTYPKRGLNSNPDRKFDYVREGYSIRKIPRKDREPTTEPT